MKFDNYTAKACVYSLQDMKPSDLNETRVKLLLEQYVRIPDKYKPKIKGEICRKLAKAFKIKYGSNPNVTAGPLVKCMNRSAEDIVKDKESLKEIAKAKGKKGLKRDLVKELVSCIRVNFYFQYTDLVVSVLVNTARSLKQTKRNQVRIICY